MSEEVHLTKYKTRAVAAMEEYEHAIEHIFQEAFDKLPKYLKDGLLSFEELGPDDPLIDMLNEQFEGRSARIIVEIEERYGFELQQDIDGVVLIAQPLPDGAVLWYDGNDFDIDESWRGERQ